MSLADDINAATLAYDAATATARIRFTGEEVFFQGHFPGMPVLPAVVQVAAAVLFAGRLIGRELRLVEVTRAKFMNPTGPGRELSVQVGVEPAEEGRLRVKALIKDGEAEVAELSLRVV